MARRSEKSELGADAVGRDRAVDLSVRQRLLDAATEVFNRKGYAAASVSEIVAAAGVTKPALYYHLKSKEGVYLELMRGAFEELDGVLRQFETAAGPPLSRVIELCHHILRLFLQKLPVARLMYAIYYGPHQGAPYFDFKAYHHRLAVEIRRIIAEGMESGDFRLQGTPDDLAWAVLGVLNMGMEVCLCREHLIEYPDLVLDEARMVRVLRLVLTGSSDGVRQMENENAPGAEPARRENIR